MESKEEKYIACMVLHGLGDTIGYKNGDWEFNYGKARVGPEYSNDLLYEFIALGGIIDINLDGWIVSDDTVMHMETAEALLEERKNVNKFAEIVSKKYIKSFTNMAGRAPGKTTMDNLELIERGVKWDAIPYDQMAAGSGASMRTSCIGLVFHKEKNRDKLIAFSIEASRITHNSVIGYLGGLVSALFTAYALEGLKIEQWPFELVKLLESDKIDNYMKKTRGYDNYSRNIDQFITFWKKYIELRFKGKILNPDKSMRIPAIRTAFFTEYFALNQALAPGFLGHDSVLVAYDALISAKEKWETLVVYSMLHTGDSDSTGCIAASWYGALYGFKHVPKQNITHLEYRNKLEQLGKALYNKN